MQIVIKQIKSRAKAGHAAFCVDTRTLIDGGKRSFFATRQQAQAYADQLASELAPNLGESWDWTFQQLRDYFVAHVKSAYDDGDITRSSKIEKERHSKTFIDLKLNNKALAKSKVRDLTTGQIRLQLMDQLKAGRSIKTVKNIMGNVRVMLDFAIDSGCRNSNPALGVKAKGAKSQFTGKEKRIQPAVIETIIAHMPEAWALRARFAATTGLRQGEQRALLWSDIDLDAGYVYVNKAVKHRADVGDTKTIKGNRKVPLTPDVKQLLQELYLRAGRPASGQLVFPSTTGRLLSDSRFLAAMHKACDAAGVERIRWHDLRHYYASRILQAFNGDWWTITNLMGHESIKTTTNEYGHWLESEEQDAKIADAISGAF